MRFSCNKTAASAARQGARAVFRHDDRVCLECGASEWSGQTEPYVPDEGERVMDPVTAYQIVWMLNGVTTRGTASKVGAALKFPVAGKTGTTNDARDAWFVGFTPDLVVGCFIGFDTPRTMGHRASGGALCAPVFTDIMQEAMKDRPKLDFRRPSGVTMVKVDRGNGCAVEDYVGGSQFIWEAFRTETAPLPGDCPSGGIVGGSSGFDAALGQALSNDPGDGPGGGGGPVTPASAVGGPGLPPRPAEPTVGLGSGGLY